MNGDVLLKFYFFLCLLCMCWHVNNAVEGSEENPVSPGPSVLPLRIGHSICAMKQDGGLCKATIERFYFNIHSHKCEPFEYGGCGGNENNFLTLEECQKKCVVKDIPFMRRRGKLQQERPAFCLSEEDPGICRGWFTRYFYNNVTEKCDKFKYGGCLGNENNFMSLEDCQITCQDRTLSSLVPAEEQSTQQPKNNSIPEISVISARIAHSHGPPFCRIPAERGNCNSTEKRFYYQHSTGKCLTFNYSGCGGNKNNFSTKKLCVMVCKKGLHENESRRVLIKTKRKRKKMPVKPTYDAIFIEMT
uniref:Tissue factor pathway inhibitor n=1 Tax=Geotrypetes seraphini TaxID=260995 RepID=A0A6P8QWE9_GEOSA|nr:tissue factor pathway inhibitor isoform X2 [Geotrypetes seraphini]